MKTIFSAFMAVLVIAVALSLAEGGEFKLGIITDKPVGRINEYAPLVKYVGKRLKPFSITGGKVVITKNVEAMVKKIEKGEVDVVFESAFSTVEMQEKGGMIPKLLVWKKGSAEYRSVIFVRKESSVQKLADLQGKKIVFEDPQSTSAYLLPKAELQSNGLAVFPLNKNSAETDAVFYLFAGQEKNQAFYVLRKRADAGAFSSDDWKEVPAGQKKELRIIHETRPVLRFVASFHPAMPAEVRDAISSVLTRMDDDPEGGKILRGAANIEKIEPLTDRHYQSLQYVRDLMRALGE